MKIDWWTFKKKAPKALTGFPTGTRVYKGFQGSGKTLSMVHYARQIMAEFPDCLVYSNIIFKNNDRVNFFDSNDALDAILKLSPGESGLLLLLDEAHLFFNKKRGISLDFLTAISQQRKNRFHIVMSSQIWEELDISLRKQVKEIVSCRSLFRTIIINDVADGETLTYDKLEGAYVAKHIYTQIFHMTKEECECYDTFQRITRNDDYQRTTGATSVAPIFVDASQSSGTRTRPRARH